jgi:hypothetical protein
MRPKVILYAAISLDGRTTGFPVDMGTFYSLAQEWTEDATLAGCDTLLKAAQDLPEEPPEETGPEAALTHAALGAKLQPKSHPTAEPDDVGFVVRSERSAGSLPSQRRDPRHDWRHRSPQHSPPLALRGEGDYNNGHG